MENQTELIEGYLRGTLSAKENDLVENLIESNDEFRQELELHKLGEELVLDTHLLELKKELTGIMNEKGSTGWKKSYTIATILILLSGSLFFLPGLFSGKNELPASVNKDEKTAEKPVENKNSNDIPDKNQADVKKKPDSPDPVTTTSGTPIIIERNPAIPGIGIEKTFADPGVNDNRQTNKGGLNTPQAGKDQLEIQVSDIPCRLPEFKIERTDACRDSETGRIIVLAGDTRKYQYAINQGEFTNESVYEGLSEGNYVISVKDEKNCIATREIRIKSRRCIADFALIPSEGDVWNLPVPETGRLKVTIFSKTGQQVFATEVRQGESRSWNGKASDGASLPMGGYAAIIENEDGSFTNVTITIVE
jgi:hypothetical protein